MTIVDEDDKIPKSPYVGLVPFEEEHVDLFFGRAAEREIITSNLMGSRLTILYGPIGVGKSSVLRAGVQHQLRLLAKENKSRYGIAELFPVVFDKWYGHPLQNLEQTIRQAVSTIDGNEEIVNGKSPLNLSMTIQTCSEIVGGRLLIILDQFEDLFLYSAGEEESIAFVTEFVRVINRPQLRVNFLIAIREDALAKLDLFKGKIPELFDNYLRIQHLSIAGAREAIEQPLRVFSQMTGADPPFTIDAALVEKILDEVKVAAVRGMDSPFGVFDSNPPFDYIETPFLQLVMQQLWQTELTNSNHRLRLATLVNLGNAPNIVQNHLNVQMESLNEDDQKVASDLFNHLVTPSGTKIPLTVADLGAYTKHISDRIESVLERLCNVRVIRPISTDKGISSTKAYAIYHDVLARAILDWLAQFKARLDRFRLEAEAAEKQEKERVRLEELNQIRIAKEEQQNTKKWNRFLLAGSTVLCVALLILLTLSLYAQRQRDAAMEAREEALLQRAIAERFLALIGKFERLVPYFQAIMRGHSGPVLSIAFSPDGKRIVTASSDKTAIVWNAETGAFVFQLNGHTDKVNLASFSPNGKLILTASSDSTARIWDAETSLQLFVLTVPGDVKIARFSPNGDRIVTVGSDISATIWDSKTGTPISVLRGHNGAITDANFSLDNQFVVTASTDGIVRTWKAQSGELIHSMTDNVSSANTAEFSPDGFRIVTANSDGNARLWDATNGKIVGILSGHKGSVNTAKFSQDGKYVVTSSSDPTAIVWEVSTGLRLAELKGHTADVTSASFSPDGARIITASRDSTARVWETATGMILFELRGHLDLVTSATFSPDGRLASTASADTTARTWDISGAGGIQVKDINIQVVPSTYSGKCPVRISAVATISVIGTGTIRYQFGRTDTGLDMERELTFNSTASKQISMSPLINERKRSSVSGAFYIQVTSPMSMKSREFPFTVKCLENDSVDRDVSPNPQPATSPTPSP